jgi:hypothetical protein
VLRKMKGIVSLRVKVKMRRRRRRRGRGRKPTYRRSTLHSSWLHPPLKKPELH